MNTGIVVANNAPKVFNLPKKEIEPAKELLRILKPSNPFVAVFQHRKRKELAEEQVRALLIESINTFRVTNEKGLPLNKDVERLSNAMGTIKSRAEKIVEWLKTEKPEKDEQTRGVRAWRMIAKSASTLAYIATPILVLKLANAYLGNLKETVDTIFIIWWVGFLGGKIPEMWNFIDNRFAGRVITEEFYERVNRSLKEKVIDCRCDLE